MICSRKASKPSGVYGRKSSGNITLSGTPIFLSAFLTCIHSRICFEIGAQPNPRPLGIGACEGVKLLDGEVYGRPILGLISTERDHAPISVVVSWLSFPDAAGVVTRALTGKIKHRHPLAYSVVDVLTV